MLPVNSVFPEFVPDQLLTSSDLNELFGYLDEQGRMTRTNLIGIGIVCGLQVSYDSATKKLTISKGTGVTSEGYLVTVKDIVYSEYIAFDAVKEIYYDRFVNTSTKAQKMPLWELKQAGAVPNATNITDAFLTDKVVLLFVELLAEKNKNCDPNSCDDKGVHVTVTFRPLLVKKTDAVTLIGGAGGALAIDTFTGLPEIKMPRFDVPNTAPVTSQDIFDAYGKVLSNGFLSTVENALGQAYTRFAPFVTGEYASNPFAGLANNFAFINDGSITTNQLQHIQYHYDLFSDLLLAYEEFRKTGSHILSTCCPDSALFPRHLLLGEAIPSAATGTLSAYRHYFIYSPLFEERELLAELKLLFKRLVLLKEKFQLPAVSSGSATSNLDTNIRITPSTLGNVPLSQKAIPYYYNVASGAAPLYKFWSYEKSAKGVPQRNLSYHAALYNAADDFVKSPLKYDLEPYNFLRIEGIIGKSYVRVLQNIKYQINQNRLPVDVIALNTDTSRVLQNINTTHAASLNFQGALSGMDLLSMLCHFQDLEAIYDTMKNEILCSLCKELKYYYDRPLTLVNLPAPPNNPPTELSSVGLFTYCNSNGYTVRPDTIGYYIEKIYDIVGDDGTLTIQILAQVFGLNAAGTVSQVNQALVYMVIFFDIPLYIIRLANTLTSSLASFDPEEYCEVRKALEQRAQLIKYLFNAGMTDSDSGDIDNVKSVDKEVAAKAEAIRVAADTAATSTIQRIFTSEDMSDHLDVLIYNCKCKALKGLKAEYLKRVAQLTLLRQFGYFTQKHPGIQHKAGVPMGGTFIIVYHSPQNGRGQGSAIGKFTITGRVLTTARASVPGVVVQVKNTSRAATTNSDGHFTIPVTELPVTVVVNAPGIFFNITKEQLVTSEAFVEIILGVTEADATAELPIDSIPEGTVIADFYLPYRCCSDCPPIQYIVPEIKEQPPANQGPVAKAGADQTIQLPTNTVTLDGSASTDPDGTITKYEWMKLSGPGTPVIVTPNSAQTNVTGLQQGTYEFELTVTDNSGNIARDSVLVTVNAAPPPANKPPVANAGPDKTYIISPTNSLTLDGSASADPDGTIQAFAWTQLSGPNTAIIIAPNLVQTPVSGLIEGKYEFQLKVTDNQGATASDTVIITAQLPENKPPIANAGADQSITLPVNTVTLDGSASSDPDGTITAYSWTVVSGAGTPIIGSPTAKTTLVSGLQPGGYEFQLKVTDDRGASATDTVSIKVSEGKKSCAPLADIIKLFDELSTVDPQLFQAFTGAYTSYKEVQAYFDQMKKVNLPSLSIEKQIEFFASTSVNNSLQLWLRSLNILVLNSDVRTLALALFRILIQLSMYIVCIQADDYDKATVPMNAVFNDILKYITQWVDKTKSFFTKEQLAIITNIQNDLRAEVDRVNNNGEATKKPNYLNRLQEIIKIMDGLTT